MRSGILAGGNWIVDHLKRIDTYPRQDTLANIIDESVGNGGSPFNILLDLAKLGAAFPLAGVGLVGNDADGAWIRQRCIEHGVDVTRLLSSEGSTSYTDVMTVQSTGRRTFFHHRGANAFLDARHFDFKTCSARIFHLGYLLLLDRLDRADAEFGSVAARVLSGAQSEGIKTSIDLVSEDSERFSSVVLPALAYTNYCILNEFELGRTTATEVRKNDRIDLDGIKAAACQLFEAGVGDAVFVHFPEGACAFRADGASWIQASVRVPQAEIVSTVGAGDAFAAGVLVGLHEEESLDRCLRFGVVAAAACLRGAGASDGIPSMEECLAEAERKGFGCLE